MLIVALTLLLQTSATEPAGAGRDTAAPGAVKTASAHAPRDPNEVVCKKDNATGHLIGTSVCRTRAEWDQLTREAGRYMDTSRHSSCIPGASC